jgi:phosphate-selective porin OprO/OprP
MGTGTALADSAKTLGGLVIESDDGNFLASLGGRIHFDYTGIMPDNGGTNGGKFDSAASENDSGFFFRRVFLSLSGKLYGWRYRIDEDFSNASNPANGFQDVYISHDFFGFTTLRVGQTKPWRSMDELSSNNDILFTSRNAVSTVWLLGGRDFQDGLFYRGSKKSMLLPTDNLWGGVSFYSLSKAGASSDQGTSTPTQGLGYTARLAYAPIVKTNEWLHFGASFSSDHADNGGKLTAGSSDYYSYKGVSQNIISFAGVQPTTANNGTLNNIPGGDNPSVTTEIGELAGAFGPAYFQAEMGQAKFRQHTSQVKGAPNEQDADAYSISASVFLTGETKRYDTDIASFAMAKPKHNFGAIELAARYDFIRNRDLPEDNTVVCKPALGTIKKGEYIDKCDISELTFGVNYYFNPAVRLMIDYAIGEVDLGSAGEDKPDALNARLQLVF